MHDDLVVKYVSAPPGTRKTTAAIEFMRRHIERGLNGDNVGYIFYVAPTRFLLDQTIKNLARAVPEDNHFMFRAAYAKRQEQSARTRVEDEIYAVLDGRSNNSMDSIPFAEGSVLFMTHASFIKLRRHDKFQDTTVIFDESRKWAEMTEKIEMKDGAEKLFHSLFDSEPLAADAEKAKSNIQLLQPKNIPDNQLVTLLNNKGSAMAFKQLAEMYTQLRPRKDEPVRMRMFGVIVGQSEMRKLVRVTLPSHPFRGFKQVLILAADFETSQMYHLLKMEGCRLKNVTVKFMDGYTKQGYGRSMRSIEERYSKLTIVPLLDADTMPSKYQLSSGVVLPKEHMVTLKEKMASLDTRTSELRDVVNYIRNPVLHRVVLKGKHAQLLNAMKAAKCELDVLKWQINMCHRLAKAWIAKRGAAVDRYGKKQKGVLIVNNDYTSYNFDPDYFQFLSVGQVEGRNEFQDANIVAFLPAVNPEPYVAQLLNALLPGYEPDEDYVVDKAIQSLGRGNIRNHNTDSEMLAVVSTRKLADKIAARMQHYPRVDAAVTERLGNYSFWSYNRARELETIRNADDERQINRDRQRRFRENPVNKELDRLRKSRSSWKRKLQTAETAERKEAVNTRLAEVEAEIQKLLIQRDAEKPSK